MKTIFKLTLKSGVRDPFLLFWSIIIPIGGLIALGHLIKIPQYPSRILTGMMATSILFYSLVTTAFAVLANRRRGVYNLLKVTPLPLWKYVLCVSAAWTLISFICGTLVLAVGIILFNIPISVASFLMIIAVILLATIGYVLFSFFIASMGKNEGQVSMISNIAILPLMLCSSSFYSLENAPSVLKTISRFNPFQWFVNGLRSSLEQDLPSFLTNSALLLAVAAGALLLSVRTFRYSEIK